MSTTLAFYIRRRSDDSLAADARLSSASSAATVLLAADALVPLDRAALLHHATDPIAYGQELTKQLFSDSALREAWIKARAYDPGNDLQLFVHLDARADQLHALHWETLCDPLTGRPIALQERVRLVRFLDSADLKPIIVPPHPALRALIVVANPSNLSRYGLSEVDVDGEIARTRGALGSIPTTILGDHADAAGRATLLNLRTQLRDAPAIVIVLAHGTVVEDEPFLWLEQDNGTAERVAGSRFVAVVEQLASQPLLLAMFSCQSAGRGYDDALKTLGPQLARVGVPAVLGFQGNVAIATVKTLLPALIAELCRDGQIDRALAAARNALGEQGPWWQIVLWLRTAGRLWSLEAPASPSQQSVAALEAPEGTMRPGSPFYIERQPTDRIALAAAGSHGGVTLTIKGPRQVGKSSLLSRVIDAASSAGKRVVYMDFQQFDDAARADGEVFFRQFTRWLIDELGLDERMHDHWPLSLGMVHRCTRYMERLILPALEGVTLLALDEVDSILDCSFRTDFFAMLRVWHNNRAMPNRPLWRQLDLALVTSTEPYELVQNLHQSPFNVGEVVELTDFTLAHVASLNRLHGAPFSAEAETKLMALLNGHPYLTRSALYMVADGRISVPELFARGAADDGPFGEHLRRHLQRLHERVELAQALRQILRTRRVADERAFWRLRGAGLVRREGDNVLARCQLYADYFAERLR